MGILLGRLISKNSYRFNVVAPARPFSPRLRFFARDLILLTQDIVLALHPKNCDFSGQAQPSANNLLLDFMELPVLIKYLLFLMKV